jgi:hypothetical protein
MTDTLRYVVPEQLRLKRGSRTCEGVLIQHSDQKFLMVCSDCGMEILKEDVYYIHPKVGWHKMKSPSLLSLLLDGYEIDVVTGEEYVQA